MTLHRITASLVLISTATFVYAAQPVKPDSLGVSKTSVFDVPDQTVYTIKAKPPGENQVLPRAYPGAPPQIPHAIDEFLPITAQANLCIACHARPDEWGKPRAKGMPTPIPQSHFTDRRNAPDKVTDHLINARYNCVQCHVPQFDAKPLVENTFGVKRAK